MAATEKSSKTDMLAPVEETEFMQFAPRQPEFCANPFPTYHYLRTHHPVYYRHSKGDWILTRYADIVTVLGDVRFGFPDSVACRAVELEWEQLIHLDHSASRLAKLRQKSHDLRKLWLSLRNPPDHTRLRGLVHHAFTRRPVADLVPQIQTIINDLIDRVQAAGEMDIMADLAYPLPVTVISEILGLPVEDREQFKQWSRDLATSIDIETTPVTRERGIMAIVAFTDYFRRLIAKRQKCPQGGLLDALIRAQAQGKLSTDELLANCALLLFTGHETTQHLIGNGMLALLHHPDQLQLLRENAALIETGIEELLRYDSPIQFVSRTALVDTEICGKLIQAGQQVVLLLGAANRDPDQFPDPDRLDITRQHNPHLAFSHGIHYCLGAQLARVEAQIAVSTLVRRLPHLALQTDFPERHKGSRIRGLKTLPVVF